MLDTLVNNGETDEAVRLLRSWETKVRPNAVMYSIILKGLAAAHRADDALEILNDMHASGVQMTTMLYNCVVDVLARVGAMDKVYPLLERMRQEGHHPDNFTCSLLVKGYCSKGELTNAIEVLNHQPEKGGEGTTIAFNTLLDGCVRKAAWDVADTLLSKMDSYGVTPSNFTLSIIVKMWGRRRQLSKAFMAVEMMRQKPGFHVNITVLSCLMSACIMNESVDKALVIFDEIRGPVGQGADEKAYNLIISGCIRHNRNEDAARLTTQAQAEGYTVYADSTDSLTKRWPCSGDKSGERQRNSRNQRA
jgi:pentatricopeptide repeat protein